ncbi:hypothetical protein Tco_1551762, partial [Tanacetum coccineum]
TSLNPVWFDLELHLYGDELLRLKVSIEGYEGSYTRCGTWKGANRQGGDKEPWWPRMVMEVLVWLLGDMVVRSWWC